MGILQARERRYEKQLELIGRVNSFCTLNINYPGNSKINDDLISFFMYHYNLLQKLLIKENVIVVGEYTEFSRAGPYAQLGTTCEPVCLKKLAVNIENSSKFGRMMDIDVFDSRGSRISRRDIGLPDRTCPICGGNVFVCIREKRHESEQVRSFYNSLLDEFRKESYHFNTGMS